MFSLILDNICLSRLLHFSAALMEKMSTLCRLVGVSVYIIVPKADETLRQVMLLWELTQGNLLVTRAVLLERNTPVDGSRFILVKERIAGMRKKHSSKYKNGRVFSFTFHHLMTSFLVERTGHDRPRDLLFCVLPVACSNSYLPVATTSTLAITNFSFQTHTQKNHSNSRRV